MSAECLRMQVFRLTVVGPRCFYWLMSPTWYQTNEDIMRNLQIEQTAIHALRPHHRNARTHSKKQIRQIANSIQAVGFTAPGAG